MTFEYGTEGYYKKLIELQERLRKSEEERLQLEIKFNEMVQITKDEKQNHYRHLRSQYNRFLEEDKKRQERNSKILRTLDRIDSRAKTLAAKTERFKILRKQYQLLLRRAYNCKPASDDGGGKSKKLDFSDAASVREALMSDEFGSKEKRDILQSYLKNTPPNLDASVPFSVGLKPSNLDYLYSSSSFDDAIQMDNKSNRIADDIFDCIQRPGGFSTDKAHSLAQRNEMESGIMHPNRIKTTYADDGLGKQHFGIDAADDFAGAPRATWNDSRAAALRNSKLENAADLCERKREWDERTTEKIPQINDASKSRVTFDVQEQNSPSEYDNITAASEKHGYINEFNNKSDSSYLNAHVNLTEDRNEMDRTQLSNEDFVTDNQIKTYDKNDDANNIPAYQPEENSTQFYSKDPEVHESIDEHSIYQNPNETQITPEQYNEVLHTDLAPMEPQQNDTFVEENLQHANTENPSNEYMANQKQYDENQYEPETLDQNQVEANPEEQQYQEEQDQQLAQPPVDQQHYPEEPVNYQQETYQNEELLQQQPYSDNQYQPTVVAQQEYPEEQYQQAADATQQQYAEGDQQQYPQEYPAEDQPPEQQYTQEQYDQQYSVQPDQQQQEQYVEGEYQPQQEDQQQYVEGQYDQQQYDPNQQQYDPNQQQYIEGQYDQQEYDQSQQQYDPNQQQYVEGQYDQQAYDQSQQQYDQNQQQYVEGQNDQQQYDQNQQEYIEGQYDQQQYDQNQQQYGQEYGDDQQQYQYDAQPGDLTYNSEYSEGVSGADQSVLPENVPVEQASQDKAEEKKTPNFADMLETDTESSKQDTKISNESDFDFSNK